MKIGIVMRILHTSDWHLGCALLGRRRHKEFEAFLNWLSDTITVQEVDVLLVAGDIFDNTAPSSEAQAQYYQFLCRVAGSCCRHVVIIGGNHDSPSFLNAPQELLKVLNVHVVGKIDPAEPEREVLVLHDTEHKPELIVCAVPYLRDREIRFSEAGERYEDKSRKLLEGLRRHYEEVAGIAAQKRASLNPDLPIIGMGHLFTAGGKTVDGDGVRELYIGGLLKVEAGVFAEGFDYLALGHLHVPQTVNGSEYMRYSGAPIPMGFGEAHQQKSVCLIDFEGRKPTVRLADVPTFQRLERIQGDYDSIIEQIAALQAANSPTDQNEENIWLEIIYDGEEIIGDLPQRLATAVENSGLDILTIRNNRTTEQVLKQDSEAVILNDLDVYEVFERCLTAHKVSEEQHPELMQAYREIVRDLAEEDKMAERAGELN